MELPGDSVPLLMIALPIVPTPPSVGPPSTVRVELGIAPFTGSLPPLAAGAPLYGLFPVGTSGPVRFVVSRPMPEIVPENFVLVLSLPVVNVPAPSVTDPAPASEPMVWLKPLRSKGPPAFTVSGPVGGRLP